MSMTGFSNIFTADDQEYAYLYEDRLPLTTGGKLPMVIPKLMGTLNGVGIEPLVTSGMFENAPECKPVHDSAVSKNDHIDVEVKGNCNWLDKLLPSGMIPKDTMFIAEFLNGDTANVYITTK